MSETKEVTTKKEAIVIVLSIALFTIFITPIWYLFGDTTLTPTENYFGLITIIPLYYIIVVYVIFKITSKLEE